MAKKSLLSSTSKKKAKTKKKDDVKKATASKKSGGAKSAKKTAPKKKSPAKQSPKATKPDQSTSTTEATPQKTVSIKELLFKKFETTPPKSLYKPPAGADKSAITSPPLIAKGTPEETEQIRKLLFKKFDLQETPAEATPPEPEAKVETPAETTPPEPEAEVGAPAEATPPEPEAKVEAPAETTPPEPEAEVGAPAETTPPEPEAKVEAPAETTPPEPEAEVEAPAETTPPEPKAEVEAPAETTPPEPEAEVEAPAETTPPEPEAKVEAPAETTPPEPKAEVEAPAETTPPEPEAEVEAPAETTPPEPEAEVEAPAETTPTEPEPKDEAPVEIPRKKISIHEVPKEKVVPVSELSEISSAQVAEPPVQERDEQDQGVGNMQKPIMIAAACLAAVLILIISVSFSNMGNFAIKENKGTVEIWKGRFSPIGMQKMMTLEGMSIPKEMLGASSKKEAYTIIFNHYVQKADTLLNSKGIPDYEAIRSRLNDAKPYAITPELKSLITTRLHKMEFMALLYRADISAGKGTLADLKAAKGFLEKASLLTLDPSEENLVKQKLQWIENQKAN